MLREKSADNREVVSGDGSTALDIDEDDIYTVLSNGRRRYVVHYLKRNGEKPVELRDLAAEIAAHENEKSERALTSDERRNVQTALQQFHLPKMDDIGFVEYDKRRGTVALSDAMRDTEIYLDIVPGKDVPWALVYLGLALVNGALLTAAMIGPLARLLSPIGVATFCVVSTLALSLAHAYLSVSRLRLGVGEGPPAIDEG